MNEIIPGDPSTREWQGQMMQSAGPTSTSDHWHFFDLHGLPETPVITPDQPDPAKATIFLRALVNHTDETGFSLQAVRYAPGAYIPRHHHDVAQVVLVLEGEAFLGNRRIGPGQGYYTPAGKGYSVQVGDDGVTLVEFRHSPLTIETVWLDDPKAAALAAQAQQ
jgi:mannose-6-phosphate isomerase-like protein (cupin superfamily)